MTAPKTYRFVTGEEIVLAEVPEDVRRAAVTIAFGTQSGPWWEQVITARVVLREARAESARMTIRAVNAEHALHEVRAHSRRVGEFVLGEPIIRLIDQTLADSQNSNPTPRRATE